jgi:hypothetical protein
MIIILHRGYWENNLEKNTIESFERTFKMGFGTETDLRDQGSQIGTSHDIPFPGVLTAEAFFDIYKQHRRSLPLALNI